MRVVCENVCARVKCVPCVTLLVAEYRRTRSVMMPPFFDDCAATSPLSPHYYPPTSVILYRHRLQATIDNCACVFFFECDYLLLQTGKQQHPIGILKKYIQRIIIFFSGGRRKDYTTRYTSSNPPIHHSSRAAAPPYSFSNYYQHICLFDYFFFLLSFWVLFISSLHHFHSLSSPLIHLSNRVCVCFVCAATSRPSSCECDLLALIFRQ